MSLNKNINEILEYKYIIPLYQRNFAWREDEISQFLQDIYETYQENKGKNYYIGSLVIIQRKDGYNEVIDGQQRLTIISLIAKILDNDLSKPSIKYDSRPEVENFFDIFYHSGDISNISINKLFHLINAIDYIKNTILNPDEIHQNQKTILNVEKEFKEYFFNKVIIVKVDIPVDTDVAAYFEIMNNRGEQLYKHEIVKARLLNKIKNKDQQQIFSVIWDSCSQMDIHIQKLFKKEKRKKYFGDNYDDFIFNENNYRGKNQENNNTIQSFTIEDILNSNNNEDNTKTDETIEDVDDIAYDKSIIDFPNFLMHIFRLLYNDCYRKEKPEQDIPLNEKYLIDIYERIEHCINPMEFIEKLLFYRVVFDRFIVKASNDDNMEDDFKWSLLKPYKYYYEKRKTDSLKYKNSFEEEILQKQIIKALSMLQVTFRQRIYKNWLQEVLSWFDDKDDLKIQADDYLQKLNRYILEYYNHLNLDIQEKSCYAEGTHTPHFLLNFIDYLYWIKDKDKFHFDFKYRNSIEHHLPQSFKKYGYSKEIIDCLGNLCLVSKSANSRMNNEGPKGKADKKSGKYYKENLPPKQKIIYDITNDKGEWGDDEIKEHYKDVILLLNDAEVLFNKSKV